MGMGTIVVLGILLLFTHCTLQSLLCLTVFELQSLMSIPITYTVALTHSNTLSTQMIAVCSVQTGLETLKEL